MKNIIKINSRGPHMKKLLPLLIMVIGSPSFGSSTFGVLAGNFKIVKILSAPNYCSNQNAPCPREGDTVSLRSSQNEAVLQTSKFAVQMKEYRFSEEGHFNYAEFTQQASGAMWEEVSNDGIFRSVSILLHLPGFYIISVRPRLLPNDNSSFDFIASKTN